MKSLKVLLDELWLIPRHLAILPENKQKLLDLLHLVQDEKEFVWVTRISHMFYINRQVLDFGEEKGWVTHRSHPYQKECPSRPPS